MTNINTCSCCEEMSRREFLRTGLFGIGVGMSMPLILQQSSLAIAAQAALDGKEAHPERILVVVEMAGGNDGLNTIIPFTNDAYHQARPRLAVRKEGVLPLNDDLGVPQRMSAFKHCWDEGKVAIVQGCGYPNPNRSHFSSMEYWHTARPNEAESLGWVGRLADAAWQPKAATLVNIAERQSLAVQSGLHAPVVFSDPNRFVRAGSPDQEGVYKKSLEGDPKTQNKTLAFVREIARTASDSSGRVREAIAQYKTPVNYGSESSVSPLSMDLKKVAALINAGFATRIYYTSIGGFDTHANQLNQQQSQLMYTWDAIGGFMKDVKRLGRANDVTVMVFTEFGRRVAENQSQGTDHGAAGPMFIVGEKAKGGLYGTYPSLTELDGNGDLKMAVDFRQVYATMIKEWLGYEDTKSILKGDFQPLGVFA